MVGISVAVAIVVGLLCSFIQSLGLTIQRKSHVQEDQFPLLSRRRPIRRPLWLVGFTIYIFSNIFSTIFQLDALPIVILAPLGAVSLIFNALLAKLILGDTFGSRAVVGTALVTLGAVLIAVFGVVEEEEHSLDELLRLWSRGAFLAFFSIVCAAIITVLVSAHIAAWHVWRQLRSGQIALTTSDTPPSSLPPSNYASPYSPPPIPFRSTHSRRWSTPISPVPHHSIAIPHDTTHDHPDIKITPPKHQHIVRFAKSPPNLSINLPSDPFLPIPNPDATQQKTLTLVGLAFAAASGTLSGLSLVLAKAAVELLVITIDHFRTGRGVNEFARAQSWFLVVGLAVGAVLQLVYLNFSLTFASPALICPLAFCFFNLSSIFDGLVFYDQFGRLAPYQMALVSIGVAILLLGVWVVSLIQPTGQGGVDVGTWVEEDQVECDDMATNTDSWTFLGGDHFAGPDNLGEQVGSGSSPAAATMPHDRARSRWSLSPTTTSSPMSPLSPTRRHRMTRYGTLVPDYAYGGAPTGFSIGLGAASPGFVLRSGSMSGGMMGGGGGHRRGRTQSESQAGLSGIMRLGDGSGGESEGEDGWDRDQTVEEEVVQGERGLRGLNQRRAKRRSDSWWAGLLRRQGTIKLPDDDDGDVEGGGRDG